MASKIAIPGGPSIVHGPPLAEEECVGSLTLGGYVREIAARYGDREAAVMWLGEEVERWSYNELLARATQVARALAACGVGKGTRVGILSTNRLEFLSCLFGTALAGGVATTIGTFFTAPELDAVLQASGCSVLLVERKVLNKDFAAMVAELEPRVMTTPAGELMSPRFPFLRHLAMLDSDDAYGGIEGWSSFLARGDAIAPEMIEARADAVSPSDPGALFFSSGSTGKVKGILSTHRGVCLQLWRWKQWYNIQEPPRSWSANGFFWSGNFCMALGSTLTSGGSLILQRWFDAEAALWLMEREKATKLMAWPHQWAQLVAAPNFQDVDLSSMHYVPHDSPVAQHPTIQTDWNDNRHAFGNTETFTLVTVYPSGTPAEVVAGSHGVPTAGATIRIVEPLTGATVPLGQRGEIAVKGPTLMLGYVGVPLDETLDDEGFLRTGDGGYLDKEGRLFWEGRLNDIIKTGGANVSPLEIDDVIRQCPGVKVSQTVGVPDDLLGEMVVTCIVAHQQAALDADSIRRFARQSLASYKVPRQVLFFSDDEITITGSAKIKTADLRELASKRLATAEAGIRSDQQTAG